MRYILLITIAAFTCSCKQSNPELSNLIELSRSQMEELAIIMGYRERDKSILKEYDLLSKAISNNSPDVIKMINKSEFLKENQKPEIVSAIQKQIDPDALKLALLGFYKPNMLDYNYPIDVGNVTLNKNGTVKIDLYSSALERSVEFATNRRDYEAGNLTTQDFEYGKSECRLNGLKHGDSVFGYFVFPYFNMERSRIEFKGLYDEKSR